MGGRDECGEEGRAPRPFIGSEGERGGRTGKGIGRPVVVASMPVVRFGGEGKLRGECGAVPGRGGDARAVHVHARGGIGGCTVGCLRKKKLGGAHAAVRGEGGGGLGLGEGGGPREEEGEWAGGRSHGPCQNRCSG
jgi:hypothetical protein